MKSARLDDITYELRLDRGDDILATVQQFCADHHIDNAAVQGIGSIEHLSLAHYSIETKQFTKRSFPGIYEIISLLGDVALADGQPLAHLHVSIAGPDLQAFGGHLMNGHCSATLELTLTAYPSHHTKSDHPDIGLKIWDFES